MKHIPKKLLTVLLAGTMAVNVGAFQSTVISSADDVVVMYEFEDGTYTGDLKAADAASGGYYIFFDEEGEEATVTIPVETSGMYDIVIGFNAQYGTKTEYLMVNDVNQGSFQCAETGANEIAEVTIGSVKLSAGDNEIGVKCSWSWVYVDYVYIQESDLSDLPEVYASDTTTCDSEATEGTQKLMAFLSSVYGEYVISGQQEYYGTSREDEFEYIETTTGELPVIRGFDFGNTCPLYAWDDQTTDRIIDWVNTEGGIATASWHVNVPVSMDSYTVGSSVSWDATTYGVGTDFVTANVMIPDTKEYEYFLLAVDNLATELLELQEAGVSLLFRPFHEAEGSGGADGSGSWFWWSKEGAEVYVELYQYLYELLTEEYGIHNLIWEFNSYTYSDESAEFYPGADYVDIIGYDKYNADGSTPNESAISTTFYSLISMYDNTKMIAMMENDTIPSVENMVDEGAYWLYFMPWYGDFILSTNYNATDTLISIYQSDVVITLDEFKEMYAEFEYDSSSTTESGETTTTTTGESTAETTTTTTEPIVIDGATMAEVSGSDGDYTISFDRAMGDTVYLIFEADSISVSNGCIGISVTVNDNDYWVAFQWSITGSETVAVDLNTLYQIYDSTAGEVVYLVDGDDGDTASSLDADTIAAIISAAQEQMSGSVQVWWAGNTGGLSVDVSNVTLVGAYLMEDTDETTTEEMTTTEEETTTVAETESETETETVTETTTTAVVETDESSSGDETTTTVDLSKMLYGDVNLDGDVNIADVVLLSKRAANLVDFETLQLYAGDVNDDGEVNTADVTVLLKFTVQIITSLPYTG